MQEAECLLDLAHAKRDIQKAAKRLADTRLKESRLRARLHQLQAQEATRLWGDAEVDVGRMNLVIERSGYRMYPTPSQAVARCKSERAFSLLHHSILLMMFYIAVDDIVHGDVARRSRESFAAQLD